MKVCARCKESKSFVDFYKSKHKSALDGYDYYCKYCRTGENLKSHRLKDKKCMLEDCNVSHYAKGYCRPHYARLVRNGTVERQNTQIHVNREYLYEGTKVLYKREYDLITKYKITLDEYKKRSEAGCEICRVKTDYNLHVDHDHNCCNGTTTCGKCVRGIICPGCNMTVDKYENGLLRNDNPKMEMIKKYLLKYKRNDILR